jgi:hypothetical protein
MPPVFHGRPMMVIAMTMAAMTQPIVIQRMPNRIHSRFNRKEVKDISVPEVNGRQNMVKRTR